MTSNSTLPMVFAVLCVLSIGVSATTLESSMRTDPDDVIDLDWERVPIGEDTAAEMKQEMQDNGDRHAPGETGEERTVGGSRRGDVEERSQAESEGREAENAERRQAGNAESQQARDGGGQAGQSGATSQQDTGTGIPDPFPWNLLWVLAAVVLGVVLLLLGYRWAGRLVPSSRPANGGGEPTPWPPADPTTDVDRAWITMVGRLDLDQPWTRTPAELAETAIEAGMDPEGVRAVTATFSEVRYGGSAVTEAHRERARSALRRIDPVPEGGPA